MGCGCGGGSGDSSSGGYLNWNTTVQYVFFKWWNASTPISFATANVLLFFFAFLFEGLLNYRARLDQHIAYTQNFPSDIKRVRGPFTVSQNMLRSVLHAFSYYVSQVLMMVFMAFNGYFCASLVLGRFAGHFFFAVFMPIAPYGPSDKMAIIGERPKACCS